MAVWQSGIVVIASAGNDGPQEMTIGTPGNVPYIITVGAMTDNYTPFDDADDVLASFSATGPTAEGFVKPDLVAPGGHITGIVDPVGLFPSQYPQYVDGHSLMRSWPISICHCSTETISGSLSSAMYALHFDFVDRVSQSPGPISSTLVAMRWALGTKVCLVWRLAFRAGRCCRHGKVLHQVVR
jgi:hypothetical protein